MIKTKQKRREYARAYYQEHKKELNKYATDWRRAHPEKTRGYHQKFYQKHKDQRKQEGQEYRQKNGAIIIEKRRQLKIEALTHYGNGKCACVTCGENRLACLSIDHIGGGGTDHRHQLGKTGNGFYRWLKKEGYPEGYQTLCMNCQFIKERA